MADISAITSLGMGALNLFVIIFIILFVGGLMGIAVFMYMKQRKFKEFKCIIIDKYKRVSFDQAGIFVDKKTNNKRFYMKKAFVGLDPNNVPYFVDAGQKYVLLFKTGLKNFHFININIDPKFELIVEEEDVNWAINAYERQKKLFQFNALMQYMPFILLAFVSLIILILFIYLFRQIGTIKEFMEVAKEIAVQLAQARSGTTVIGG